MSDTIPYCIPHGRFPCPTCHTIFNMPEQYTAPTRAVPPTGSVPVRVLLSEDPFCPKCGHNRDTSATSTIDEGYGVNRCQRCSAAWQEFEA